MTAGSSATARRRQLLLIFGVCSLAAVAVGILAATTIDVGRQTVLLNLVAWVFGAVLAAILSRVSPRLTPAWLGISLAMLLLTLRAQGLSDVHRWFAIGPLRMNAAELVLPFALAFCGGLDRSSLLRIIFPSVATVLLSLQPDASQAVAVAAASVVVLLTSSRSTGLKAAIGLVSIAAASVSILRPDHLAPVAQVEGIVILAAHISPVVACLGIAAIAGSLAAPLLLVRDPDPRARDAALALAAYSTLAALAPVVGAFPVPLMGMAVSPILGAWLGLGALLQLASADRRASA